MSNYSAPTHEDIERCAFFIYVAEGRPEQHALAHWLQAEAQLIATARHEAGLLHDPASAADPTQLHGS